MTTSLRLPLFAVLLFGAHAAPAFAADRYDVNCVKFEQTADEQEAEEMAKTSPIVNLAYSLGQKTCKGVDVVRNLFSSKPDPDDIGLNDVFEASKPEPSAGPPSSGPKTPPSPGAAAFEKRVTAVDQRYGYSSWSGQPRQWGPNTNAYEQGAFEANIAQEEAKLNGTPDYTMMPPDRQGGFIKIFEARGGAPTAADGKEVKPGDIDGQGVLLTEDGVERGNFVDEQLDGRGEEIDADGTWRGGTFKADQLEGQGFEIGTENGEQYLLEGDFVAGEPDGMVTMTYGDGDSQRIMWVDGQVAATGTRVAAGEVPEDAPYKSPAQMAAEADAAFEASLAQAANAGVLFAQADELTERGDSARARRVFRALITRFPDSPLAARAADRLSGSGGSAGGSQGLSGMRSAASGGSGAASAPAKYGSVCDRDGTKINDMEAAAGGIQTTRELYAAYADLLGRCASYDPNVKSLYDQYASLSLSTPPGAVSAGADRSIAEVNKALANPNYSAELGPYRLGPGGTGGGGGSTAQAGGRCPADGNGFAAFDRELGNWNARYPVMPNGGIRDSYQFKMFFGTEGLKILAQYRDCMNPGQYEQNRAALQGQLDEGKINCPQFSSDGGANCVAEYPRNWR